MIKVDQQVQMMIVPKVPKESMIPKKTYYPEHNIMVEALIEFEGSNDNILSISPKEHTTDPENMVYTWLDQLLDFFCLSPQRNIPPIPRTWYTPGSTITFLLLITAQANPISHATDPGNMTCYCR